MNFLVPLLGVVFNTTYSTLDKVALSFRGVNYKSFNAVSFPLSFLGAVLLFIIVRPPLSLELFSGNAKWLLLAWVGVSVFTNLIFYRALENDTLGEMQIAGLLKDVLIIAVSSTVFADERNILIIIPALVASSSVVWSHWEQRRFQIKKTTLLFVAYSLIAAPTIASISKVLLHTWDPVSLQMVRWGMVSVIVLSLFFRSVRRIPRSAFPLLILTNFLSVAGWALYYYSYQRSGIIYTVLLFSLQPFLVYLASLIFLKEKFHPRKTAAFMIVLVSIIVAHILR